MEKFVIILILSTVALQERSPKQLFLSAFNPYTYTSNGHLQQQQQQPLASQQFQYLGISPQISPLYAFWSNVGGGGLGLSGQSFVSPQQQTQTSSNLEHQQPKVQWTSQLLPSAVQSPSSSQQQSQQSLQLQQLFAQANTHPQTVHPYRFQAPLSTSSNFFHNIWNYDVNSPILPTQTNNNGGAVSAPSQNAHILNLNDPNIYSISLQGNPLVTSVVAGHSAFPVPPKAFQRGQVESRPQEQQTVDTVDNDNYQLRVSSVISQSPIGFVRGHVESKPGDFNRFYNHENQGSPAVRHVTTAEDSTLTFNREAVEHSNNDAKHGNNGLERSVNHQSEQDDIPTVYQSSTRKVVCYFASWAAHRKGKGTFVPENVDPTLCTHVIYAFANLDKKKLAIKMSDPYLDDQNNFYKRIVALKEKNPLLKVLLALGGWSDSGDDKYSFLAHSFQGRPLFAKESRDFLKSRGFDGLSLDWHYPKCWQSNCEAGPDSDRTAFSDLIRELKAVYEPAGLLVSATLSGYKEVIDVAYDVPNLSQHLDLMNVMAYDYHGAWESRTGHVAPLYMGNPAADPHPHYNANFTLEYYVSLGADRSKLVLGVPMYGQSFQLENEGDAMVGSRAKGPGNPGESTNQPGMLAYYEICKRVKHAGWQVVKDLTGSWGPYAHLRDQWVGFDDSDSLTRKSRFVKSQNYGGVFVWTMDLDDFRNECCRGTQPLLRTIAKEILGVPYDSNRHDCNPPPEVVTPAPSKVTTAVPGYPTSPSTTTKATTIIWWVPSSTTTDPITSTIDPTITPSATPTESGSSETPIVSSATAPVPEISSSINPQPQPASTPAPEVSTSVVPDNVVDLSTSPPPSPATQTTTPIGSVDNSTAPSTTATSTLLLLCQQVARNSTNNPSWITPGPDWQTTSTTTTTTQQPSTSWEQRPTTSQPTQPQELTTVMPGETCDNAWSFKPDSSDCSSYYQCVSGKVVKQRCPYGLHWNRYARACDWPQSAKCQSGDIETSSSSPTQPPPTWSTTQVHLTQSPTGYPPAQTTSRNPYRECIPGEYYPAPNCDQYYLCNNGLKKLQSCGPGLHWNQMKKLCDWPKSAMCAQEGTRMEDPPAGEQCEDGSYTGSKEDCEIYLVCVHGRYMQFRCQTGLHWNNQQKVCDWPQNAGCSLSGPKPPTVAPEVQPPPPTPTQEWATSQTMSTNRPSQTMVTERPATMTNQPMTTNAPVTQPVVVQPVEGGSKDFMVVCYFTNWAWYRQGIGKYKPENIDSNLCTHVVYGFAVLDPSELVIKPHDTWADFDNKFYEQVTALRSRGTKVTIAIGGWNDSLGDKYSRLVNNAAARRKFIAHVVDFIKRNNFDGLDLDWEYPKCWQVDCDKGPASDKPAFAAFVRELWEAFQPHGLLLSSAVSPSKTVIDQAYDIPTLSRYFDWIAVMTYDYHGQWDKKTGHVAPLYFHDEADYYYFNTNYTINYWISQGADKRKIVMGMPLYGQSFTLSNPSNNGLNAPASGGGTAGEFTKASGFLSYYEICRNIQRDGWTVVPDSTGAIGPYAYKGNQWVSFDDVAMIKRKSQLIRDLDIAGGMVWALDLDDFQNTCGQGKYPLLTTIKNVLSQPRDGIRKIPMREKHPPAVTPGSQGRPDFVASSPMQISGASPLPQITAIAIQKPVDVTLDPCNGEAFRPHPKDCRRYQQCVFGRYHDKRCPGGTFWNRDHCDWECGSQPSSTGSQVSTMKPSTTTTTPRPTTMMTTMRTTQSTTMRTTTTQNTQLASMSTTTIATPIKVSPTQGWKPALRTTTTIEPVHVMETEYKVVCYFTNWAWYRQGIGKYKPEDIDYNLCTHIAYGFAVLNPSTLQIRPHDSWADIDNSFYTQVTSLRSKGKKVVIAIGGWNDSAGDKYSKLVTDPEARRRFIANVVEFIDKWGFDGLDLDWEYPKCWQTDCKKGPESDKQNFATFVRELSAAFKPKGLLLSSAVSPSKVIIEEGYDVPTVSQYLDWVAVMTYDYHGQWDKKTGHVAPLYHHEESDNFYFNTNYSINYWLSQGADRKKIVMGMSMYGQSFSLADASNTGLNSKSYGGGEAGEYTRAQGFLAYYEICTYVQKRGWTMVQDSSGAMGPYAYKGNQWVSFDDANMVRRKAEYIKEMGLGGGMIWALDLDDFRGVCGCEKHPLLKTINRVLRSYPEPDPHCNL